MRTMNHSFAKVLVWLAAALMPWDLSFASACPCAGGTPGTKSSKSCCGTSACTCHHQVAQPVKRSCCSGRSSLQAVSPAAKDSLVKCTCHAKDQPQPQTPPNDSRNLKEPVGTAAASSVSPLAIPPTITACASAADFTFYPLSALERCGALCRFLI
jgi:hypothetical protein